MENMENNAQQGGRLFTQEEVDNIVKERLAREQKKNNNINNGMSPNEADYQDRLADLEKRERMFEAQKQLHSKGLPEDAINLINFTDAESMQKSIEALESIHNKNREDAANAFLKGGKPPKAPPQHDPESDDVRKAFGLR